MSPRYSIQKRWLPPNASFSASLGNGWDIGTTRVGVVGAITYGNNWQQLNFRRNYYDAPQADGTLQLQNSYLFDQATNEVNLGAFLTAGAVFSKTNSIRYVGMLNRSSTDETREYQGFNGDLGEDFRLTRLRWVEREIFYNQLLGNHRIGIFEINWRGALADAGRSEPDNREYRFDNEGGTPSWRLSDRPEGNQRFFSDNAERFMEGGLDLTFHFTPDPDDTTGRIKIGGMLMSRTRGVDTRRYKYFHRFPNSRNNDLLSRPIEEILIPRTSGWKAFRSRNSRARQTTTPPPRRFKAPMRCSRCRCSPGFASWAGRGTR